jgi:hypothetical protein
MHRRVPALLPALLCAAPLAAARPQDPPPPQDAPRQEPAHFAETAEELDALLWERDRELLHKGSPLSIVGLEQAENALRAGTPALARTDGAVAFVDVEELRQRKIAMYEQHASFHLPPSAGSPPPDAEGDARDAASRSTAGGTGQGAARSWSIGWLFGLLSLAALVAAYVRARRYAR